MKNGGDFEGEGAFPSQALKDYRKGIMKKREELLKINQEFAALAGGESDNFRRVMAKMIAKYASIFEDLFTNIETYAVAQGAIKDQIDLLKDIVIQIPDVQRNSEMQKDIARLFKQYSETH